MKNNLKLWSFLALMLVLLILPAKTVSAERGWMSERKPYQYTSVDEYLPTGSESFVIGGKEIFEGYVFYNWYQSSLSQVLYNLEGEYETFAFDIGRVDSTRVAPSKLYIYMDGLIDQTISLDANAISTHVELDVDNVQHLKIVCETQGHYYDVYYGVFNGEWTKNGTTAPEVKAESWIEECVPYETVSADLIYLKDDAEVLMGGISYSDAIRFYLWNPSNTAIASYNLDGCYESFTFKIGHVDGTTRANGTLRVKLDGITAKEISMTPDALPQSVTVDLTDANQMILEFTSPDALNTYSIYYAIGEGQFVSNGNTVPEEVVDPWIDDCKPYETASTDLMYSKDDAEVLLGGVAYSDAMRFYLRNPAGSATASYNLGGDFKSFTFNIGRVDGETRANGTLKVKLDGTTVQEITLKPETLPQTVTVDLTDANQMILEFTSPDALDTYHIYYAIAEGKFVSNGNVRSIALNESSVKFTKRGETKELIADVRPRDAVNKEVIWSSSNPSVAAVDANGKITSVGHGNATIYAETADGGYQASCDITVELTDINSLKVSYPEYTCTDTYLEKNISFVHDTYTLKNGVDFEVVCDRTTEGKITVSITGIGNYHGAITKELNDKHNVVTDEAVEETCTSTGLTKGSHCEICGEVIEIQEVIPANGHKWSDWKIVKEATMTEEGMEERTCGGCGETEKRIIDKIIGNPFTDVAEGKFYYNPVLWAVQNEITSGMTPTTFVPNGSCTRGQVVTFLWRAKGSPEPKVTEHSFTDVNEGSYYYKAMLWAVENGITTGMTSTTFAPNGICTRGQVVTFLWRANNKPQPESTEHPFTDVNEGSYYYTAMLWAVENDITSGMTPTTFQPNGNCTRGQVVTFLYRALN